MKSAYALIICWVVKRRIRLDGVFIGSFRGNKKNGLEIVEPKQIESIQSFASEKDTFVALPTGYGKSVIFAILPLLFDFMRGKL